MSPLPSSGIAELNDAFRRSFVGGTVMLTRGVDALSPAGQAEILALGSTVRHLRTRNDPYGGHDFGAAEYAGIRYFWKIDYYDLPLNGASPNAADPAVTHRVLTIMRADEY
jgi:hypothetical protein